MSQALLDDVDNEHLACLQAYEVPLPIEEWDGWHHPSENDVTHLHLIMDTEESQPVQRNRDTPSYRRGIDALSWVQVDQDGLPHYLASWPAEDAQEYMREHPLDLLNSPKPN